MQDFDQFQMPPALVQQLYTDSLFPLNKIDEKPSLPIPMTGGYHAIGYARNGLAVVIKSSAPASGPAPTQSALPGPAQLFLENILKACKRQFGETLILLLSENYQLEEIQTILQAQEVSHVLMFGAAPADLELPAHFPSFQPQLLAGRKFLWAPALAELEDQESKKNLWAALKNFFGI